MESADDDYPKVIINKKKLKDSLEIDLEDYQTSKIQFSKKIDMRRYHLHGE
jgi:hypothetical protein